MRWSVFPASRSEARHAVGATSLLSLTVQTCGVSRIFDLDPDKVDQFCENLAVSHQEVDMPFHYSSEFPLGAPATAATKVVLQHRVLASRALGPGCFETT